MNKQEIKAPIPVRHKVLSALKSEKGAYKITDSKSPPLNIYHDLRTRSVTPNTPTYGSVYQNEAEYNLETRTKFYNLDFPDDKEEYERVIYDPKSRWFSRKVKPKFEPRLYIPYMIETHKDQAKYITQILTNLYIAISSMDIEGLIPITSKDLADLKSEVDDLALKTDLFTLSSRYTPLEINGKIRQFNEDELYDENCFSTSQSANVDIFGKITVKSSAIVNINHWTNELRNCLDFNFPVSLRKSLATVFYYLALTQGQDISRDLFVDVFEILVDENDDGTNYVRLLKEHGLILDHTILFNFICDFFPYPDSDYAKYDLSSKSDLKLFRILLRLAHYSKPFFNEKDVNLLKNAMDLLLSSFSPSTISIILPIITSYIPFHFNKICRITDYLPFCFSLWTSVSATIAVDTHLFEFTGDIAKDVYERSLENGIQCLTDYNICFDKFGIFTKEQITFLFNRLQGHLRFNTQIDSYTKLVQSFIYSINGSKYQDMLNQFSKLLKTIETFVHPSNTGIWTKPIAKFVHCFIKMYHKRIQYEKEEVNNRRLKGQELCLTKECNDKIIDLFLNIVNTGAQNRGQNISNFYISCISYLLDLDSSKRHLIFDHVLENTYDFLAGEYINSKHRAISSLKQLTKASRFLVADPFYRIHITNILSLLVTKLDPNDLPLTSQIINAIVSTISFVPISKLVSNNDFLTFESYTLPLVRQHYQYIKEHDRGIFPYDKDLLTNAFEASTTEFENILRVYVDKIFSLVDVEVDEGLIIKINQTTMIMIESMDNDMLNYFSNLYKRKFWDNDVFNVKDPNYELVTIPLAALARNNEKMILEIVNSLIHHIRLQIEKGAGSIRSYSEIHQRDIRLVLYLTTLNDILRQSHSAILKMDSDLVEFIIYVYDNISNPPLDVLTSILVHSTLSSLTNTEIVNYSLFSKNAMLSSEEKWGGLQNDTRLYDPENLDFQWHIPTKEEISYAVTLFERVTNYCIEKIYLLMSKPTNDKTYTDMIQKYILVLSHCLSGCSLLFDPDFNKNKSVISNISSYREKLYLLKQIRDKNCDNDELNIDVEQIHSEKDESLYTITDESSYNQYEDDIVVIDDSKDENFMVEDSISEVPSTVGTPVPSNQAGVSLMNASLAQRDMNIFMCNYFFGVTTDEKLKHPDYIRVHDIRSKIGLLIHKLFLFLSEQCENNTKLFIILLHGLKVWLTDVGKESLFSDDPGAFLDIEFIENIQLLSHRPDAITRTYLAVKLNDFHQSRILMRSTNRYPSRLEIQLLNDIILMSTSVFPDIHKVGQTTLVHSMKQIIGSYSILINQIIQLMENIFESKDYKRLDGILKVLSLKKVRRKILRDYKNMETLLLLLIRCCKIKEDEVSYHASNIIADFVSHIKIPSHICLFDKRALNMLAPEGLLLNLKVNAVKMTKEKKRRLCMEKLHSLRNKMLSLLQDDIDMTWKNTISIISLAARLESNLQMPTDKNTLKVIVSCMNINHPSVINTALRSILSIFNKFLSLADYQYDIERAFSPKFDPFFIRYIDTLSPDYKRSFKKEMCNFYNPTYFLDSQAFVGWLCWGVSFKALMIEEYKLDFRFDELEAMKMLGQLLTEELFIRITSTVIKDNESRSTFSGGEVSFFVLVILLSEKYNGAIRLEYLIELCQKYYDRTDKASMIMTVEIIAALICSFKYLSSKTISKVEDFLAIFLPQCLNYELNQDGFEIWCTLFWWLPTVVDIRRSKSLCKYVYNIKGILNTQTDDAAHQSYRLIHLKNVMLSLEYKSFDGVSIIKELVFDHPYEQVRENVAKLFVTIIQNESYPGLENSDKALEHFKTCSGLGLPLKIVPESIDKFIKQLFLTAILEYKNVLNLSPQEVLKTKYYYRASTLFYWIKEMSRGPTKILLVPYIDSHVIPFLITLLNQRDVCKISGLDPTKLFLIMTDMPLRSPYIGSIVDRLCQVTPIDSSYQIRVQLTCIEYILSLQLLQLSDIELNKIREYVLYQLYNENFVEVRIRASSLLSEIIHCTGVDTNLLKKFNKDLPNCSWEQKQKLSKTDTRIHSTILGIGAIISAFPYIFPLPKWIPKELSLISSWARTTGIVGTTTKNIISQFKKVRVDTWIYDRTVFTSEELEDLEGVLWRSYYA